MKTVLVFGVFDGLHPGHDHFLRAARALGDRLVVAVARDSVVEQLKGRRPHQSEQWRHAELLRHNAVSETVLGDEEMGTYNVVRQSKPDLIVLGYDQKGLEEDLRARMSRGELAPVEIHLIDAHAPHLYKSSLLRPKS